MCRLRSGIFFVKDKERNKEMAITAAQVKELREKTGAGMMECKKALTEKDGDMDAAEQWLKEHGAVKAAKKANRIAAEGLCCVSVAADNKSAAVVEVNSETDFVAKNEKFQAYVKKVADQALAGNASDLEGFLAEADSEDPSKTVKDTLTDMIAVIGEKLDIRRFKKVVTDGTVVSYVHGGGKIAVIVEGEGAEGDAVKEALTNVAMQVAAMTPQYVSQEDISEAERVQMRDTVLESSLNDPFSLPKPILQKYLDKAVNEKVWSDADIAAYNEQKNNKFLVNFISDEGKAKLAGLCVADKAAIAGEKIFSGAVDGRVSKQMKEICLLEQVYVKAADGKQSVKQYLQSVDAGLKVKNFIRFETGEGMEKKSENFAEEVAKQMQ